MTTRPRLLVVDDEPGIRESLSSILRDEGYHVESVASAEEALERASAGDVEVILLDVWLPGMDGLEALSRLQASHNRNALHRVRIFFLLSSHSLHGWDSMIILPIFIL